MEQHTYEYRLHKVVVLAECIRDLVNTIDSERDENLRQSLLHYASMINNTAEQMLCNSRKKPRKYRKRYTCLEINNKF